MNWALRAGPVVPCGAADALVFVLRHSGGETRPKSVRLKLASERFQPPRLECTDPPPYLTAVDRRSTPSAQADRQDPLPMFRCPGLPGFPADPPPMLCHVRLTYLLTPPLSIVLWRHCRRASARARTESRLPPALSAAAHHHRPSMFSFCFNDGCVNCEPRIKRSRRSAGPPVRFAVECAEVRSAQPRVAEPLFLLERLAHIRCFTLTLCGPEGARLQGASVRVTGSVADVLCELAPVDGVHASVPEQRLCLRLDVGEPLDAAAATTISLADGYAYIRLPLLADTAGLRDRDPMLAGWELDLATRSAGSGADLQDRRIGRDLREEAGLLGRAAGLLRQERRALLTLT